MISCIYYCFNHLKTTPPWKLTIQHEGFYPWKFGKSPLCWDPKPWKASTVATLVKVIPPRRIQVVDYVLAYPRSNIVFDSVFFNVPRVPRSQMVLSPCLMIIYHVSLQLSLQPSWFSWFLNFHLNPHDYFTSRPRNLITPSTQSGSCSQSPIQLGRLVASVFEIFWTF